jgi:hypothetical protein
MKKTVQRLALGAALVLAAAAPAVAQQGFALKGGLVFNKQSVEGVTRPQDVPAANGFGVGVEYVLPGGLGLGVSGYTAGTPKDFSTSEGTVNFLAEANYFLRLPLLPVAPYAGLNMGLGSSTLGDAPDLRPEARFGDVGYQIGVRFQLIPMVGLDAQYRRVRGKVANAQDASFDANQVLVGVTLF